MLVQRANTKARHADQVFRDHGYILGVHTVPIKEFEWLTAKCSQPYLKKPRDFKFGPHRQTRKESVEKPSEIVLPTAQVSMLPLAQEPEQKQEHEEFNFTCPRCKGTMEQEEEWFTCQFCAATYELHKEGRNPQNKTRNDKRKGKQRRLRGMRHMKVGSGANKKKQHIRVRFVVSGVDILKDKHLDDTVKVVRHGSSELFDVTVRQILADPGRFLDEYSLYLYDRNGGQEYAFDKSDFYYVDDGKDVELNDEELDQLIQDRDNAEFEDVYEDDRDYDSEAKGKKGKPNPAVAANKRNVDNKGQIKPRHKRYLSPRTLTKTIAERKEQIQQHPPRDKTPKVLKNLVKEPVTKEARSLLDSVKKQAAITDVGALAKSSGRILQGDELIANCIYFFYENQGWIWCPSLKSHVPGVDLNTGCIEFNDCTLHYDPNTVDWLVNAELDFALARCPHNFSPAKTKKERLVLPKQNPQSGDQVIVSSWRESPTDKTIVLSMTTGRVKTTDPTVCSYVMEPDKNAATQAGDSGSAVISGKNILCGMHLGSNSQVGVFLSANIVLDVLHNRRAEWTNLRPFQIAPVST
jgi:hypothetical protein